MYHPLSSETYVVKGPKTRMHWRSWCHRSLLELFPSSIVWKLSKQRRLIQLWHTPHNLTERVGGWKQTFITSDFVLLFCVLWDPWFNDFTWFVCRQSPCGHWMLKQKTAASFYSKANMRSWDNLSLSFWNVTKVIEFCFLNFQNHSRNR